MPDFDVMLVINKLLDFLISREDSIEASNAEVG